MINEILSCIDGKLEKNIPLEEIILLFKEVVVGLYNPHQLDKFLLEHFNKNNFVFLEKTLPILIGKFPNHVQFYNLWGLVKKNLNKYDESIEIFNKAIKLNPSAQILWANLGNTYLITNKPKKAFICFEEVLKITPNEVEILRLQAMSCIVMGDVDKAENILSKALEIQPNNKMVRIDFGCMYYNQKRYHESFNFIADLVEEYPEDFELLKIKAQLFENLGNIEDAFSCYELAYQKVPGNMGMLESFALFLLANRHKKIGADYLDIAVNITKSIFDSIDDLVPISGALQNVFINSLEYDLHDKLFACNKAIMNYWINKNQLIPLLMRMSRVKTIEDKFELLEVHKKWGIEAERRASQHPIAKKIRYKDNKVRIGFFSSYLQNGPVGYFIWPLINNLQNYNYEVYCYSASSYKDEVQNKIISKIHKFTRYHEGENERVIAQSIADDNLDVVFELGGFTRYSKIEAFAYRVAPIQISWLGYPHSVGLPTAIDYILLDPYINPPDRRLIIEKPLLMPKTWMALDKVGFSDFYINQLIPEERNGYITFGTLNAGYKILPKTLDVWADIMHSVPGSKFLCVRPDTRFKIFRDNFCKHMEQRGINRNRIDFIASDTNHLNCYNLIDISLDTFPQTGGTTTCESLWMGVPVVTLVGDTIFERISYSNLNNCGLGDLCAFNLDDYKNITYKLVGDVQRRKFLRVSLRKLIKNSPLGQPEKFADDFVNAVNSVLK